MTEVVDIPIQMIPSDEKIYLPQESEVEIPILREEENEIVEKCSEKETVSEEVADVIDGAQMVLENGIDDEKVHVVPVEVEKDDVVEEEVISKEEHEDEEEEDEIINFNVPTPPSVVAKPIDIIPTPSPLTGTIFV